MTFVADTTTTVNGHSVGIYFGFVLGVVNKIYVVSKVADWKWLQLRQKLKPWLIVMHEGFKATFLSIKYFH